MFVIVLEVFAEFEIKEDTVCHVAVSVAQDVNIFPHVSPIRGFTVLVTDVLGFVVFVIAILYERSYRLPKD